jgi:hypothetical protein
VKKRTTYQDDGEENIQKGGEKSCEKGSPETGQQTHQQGAARDVGNRATD